MKNLEWQKPRSPVYSKFHFRNENKTKHIISRLSLLRIHENKKWVGWEYLFSSIPNNILLLGAEIE